MGKVFVVVVDAGGQDTAVVLSRDGRVLERGEREVASAALAAASSGAAGVELVDVPALREAVQAAEALSRLHFEHDITADFVADMEGRLLACNPAFVKLFELESEEHAREHRLSELYPSPRAYELFIEALSEARSLREHRVELRTRPGKAIFVFQNVTLDFDAAGAPQRIRGYIENRTAERNLEDELQRWQRLEAVGRLAGGVAHDFNNLLTVILNYAQLLERQLPGGSSARVMVGEVSAAGERAADLTRRLLAFGRRQSLQSRPVDLNDLIVRLMPLLKSVVGESIELDIVFGKGLGSVNADPGLLEQVLMNLVVNARDAMPNGGKLTIETETVLVDAAYRRAHPWANTGRYVLLSVSDNGIGMPREVLAHVFEPFFTTKPPGTGTGLGLASSYGIVKQHGGMLHAYSEESVGTTIKMYLPLAARPASSVGPKLAPRVRGGDETVLLAEDDPSVRQVVSTVLRDRGYVVLEADSGETALELLASHPEVAIAIFDVVMPGIGGLSAYEKLRARAPSLPVILTSGYTGELASEGFAEDSLAYFLPKPYSPENLLEQVRRILDDSVTRAG